MQRLPEGDYMWHDTECRAPNALLGEAGKDTTRSVALLRWLLGCKDSKKN